MTTRDRFHCLERCDQKGYTVYTVNLVRLATDKTLDFYYTVITNDLNERIFLFCGYRAPFPVASFTKLTVEVTYRVFQVGCQTVKCKINVKVVVTMQTNEANPPLL